MKPEIGVGDNEMKDAVGAAQAREEIPPVSPLCQRGDGRGDFVPVGFFEENPGERSLMRLMSMISLLAGVVAAFLCLAGFPADPDTGLGITALFMACAFCPKAVQKFAENMVLGRGK